MIIPKNTVLNSEICSEVYVSSAFVTNIHKKITMWGDDMLIILTMVIIWIHAYIYIYVKSTCCIIYIYNIYLKREMENKELLSLKWTPSTWKF